MADEKAVRGKLISFRVSEAEHELITRLAQGNELGVSEYVRKRALSGEIVQPKLSKAKMREIVQILHQIQAELGKQGSNLNQIARYLRLKSSLSDFNTKEVELYPQEKTRGLEGEYERFRRGVGEIWRLLGK